MNDRKVKVRIAPSPTGDPHVGTAYIALFNYAFAKKMNGSFILRIEDTDQARSTESSEDAIMESLKWLGLQWDEGPDIGGPNGPYRQSERKEIYKKYAMELVESGHAYPCFCTSERLNDIRKKQRLLKQKPMYDGKCRSIPREEAEKRIESGEPYVLRLAVPKDGTSVVLDRLRGKVTFNNSEIDDQVLMKSDGFPTYHLANVVDDHLMGVTHVVRAEEWINSLPKHFLLYRAFGWEPPEFVHMPLLRNKDKSKISKRKNPVNIDYYRSIGILPQAMLNFLAMMGYSMPDGKEQFSLDEFVTEFSFDRVSLGGPVFDIDKLMWLNGTYMRQMDDKDLLETIQKEVLSTKRLAPIVPLVKERIRTLGEFADAVAFYFLPQVNLPIPDVLRATKQRDPKETSAYLKKFIKTFDDLKDFSNETINAHMRAFAEQEDLKTREFFMVVRLAVTGRKASPPLIETMGILGRAACAERLRMAAEKLNAYRQQPQK